jgi:hypothetical protein
VIDPESGASQWDSLRIGEMRSPGACRLSGDGLRIGWDVQNATATAGATTKRINAPLKKFSAEFDLSNAVDDLNVSDFDLWDPFQTYLLEMVADQKKPFARDVYHPDLARVGITSVTLEGIGLMTPDGKGGGKIKVDFLEHRPPKPNKAVASTKTEGDKQIDAATAQLKQLQDEYKTISAPKTTTLGATL